MYIIAHVQLSLDIKCDDYDIIECSLNKIVEPHMESNGLKALLLFLAFFFTLHLMCNFCDEEMKYLQPTMKRQKIRKFLAKS